MLQDLSRTFADRAGIRDRKEAERSASTIAYELGGVLMWGDAQRLAHDLPAPLARAVHEGSFGTAMARFSGRAFVQGVAERDGVGFDEARRRVVAFLDLLRDQLPGEFGRMQQELASWDREPAL